ncbi:MAG: TonB-dependent receptor [Pseudomonadota bacterium]|nr:TonB-dependent receptor [Pseudomonadota bacterium]
MATPPAVSIPAAGKRMFVPADFVRFAPKTAFDMIVQLPGFTLRGANQERGLGQASENVLINGARVANKSGGAIAELQKLSAANVERIEIADAAQLGVAGLSGEVANVIVKAGKKPSGQFEWRPEIRAHYATPFILRGSASYSATTGPADYTLSIEQNGGHGAFGGPVTIDDRLGERVETRHQVLTSDYDQAKLSGRVKLDGPGSSVANLTASWSPYWYRLNDRDRRIRTDGDDRTRLTKQRRRGYMVDFNGDYEFAVGPGRLKAIGLRQYEHEPTVTKQVSSFDSGAPDSGVRFARDARIGETIGRLEYGWKSGKNDWQVTLERADNRLEQIGRLFALSPRGSFEELPFPGGSGTVAERRYEASATFSRPLSSKLDVQLVGGAEVSRLDRVDGDLAPRQFFRPKGSVTLGWRPDKGWDTSLKLRRRVGQISFYDFLAQPNLSNDRENAANPDLVPPQSWEVEGEAGRDFGRWGKTRLKLYGHRIDDIVDIIPIGENGEAIGNLPRATRIGLQSTSTFLFDPVGWKGAKLDLTISLERSRVRDPLTGEARPISGNQLRSIAAALRHDVPGSKIAWGLSANHNRGARSYFLSEIGRGWEGPVFASAYVEHKDIFGLTVRATAGNLLNARHRFERAVYAGRRERDPLLFVQRNNQLIGPIFNLSVRGNF